MLRRPLESSGRKVLPLAILLLCGTSSLHAQGLGSAGIFGEVRDRLGEPVPQAQVEARYLPRGTVIRALTNTEGRYQLVNLRSGGPYEVVVTALGYAELERSGIDLRAEQRLRLDLTLTEQAITLEGLEVTLDRRFEVSRAGPALTVTQDIILTHPTIERNFMELAALSPVAVQTSEEGGISISGQNESHNAILIDGALNQDVFGQSSSGMPGAAARAKPIPLDAIQEFRVDVAPFDPRSSGFTGGVLNAITRSGTNRWEGSAFTSFRNERFFGDLLVDGANVAPEDYRRHVSGFTLGGPLRVDRAHVFIAAEFEDRSEPAPGFSLGVHDDIQTRVASDSLSRMAGILQDSYGVDPGVGGQVSLANPLQNVFTRFDWSIGDAHTLTLRHNFARAARDSTPNRAAFGAYELSSAGHRVESTNHATTGRLVTRLAGGHSNEFSFNLQRTRDRSLPNSLFPQMDVRISSEFDDEVAFTRNARAGSRYFRQHDRLDQTLIELSDVVTLARDDIVTTFGANVDIFRFDQDHRPGSLGYYRFDTLDDLAGNRPSYYEVNVLDPDVDPSVRFTVVQPSVFVQNEHRLPPELVLRYGLRVDVPVFPDRPGYNEAAHDAFDLRTDRLPSGARLFSPRIGFNWQSQREWVTQVRGGWGIFTGRVPFVWMANAYKHSGLRSATLFCEGENVPSLDPGSPAPATCLDGVHALDAGEATIVVFEEDFRYPRELKVSGAVDQELPADFYLSLEGLVVQTHGRTTVRDANIRSPQTSLDDSYVETFGPRANYGTPTELGYRPRRRVPGFAQVLVIERDKHTSIAYSLTGELQKRFGRWVELTGSATYSRSDDLQSLVFTDMVSNYAAAPIGRQITDVSPRPANFDRPWKFLVNGRSRLPAHWGGTELSVLYVGQSGQPYSYVYGSDINGDGYSGPGIPVDASNDLVWVPSLPAQLRGTFATRSLFSRFVSGVEPCLSEVRGEFARRNACRAPATHRVDLRVAQPLEFRGAHFEVTADLLNVLNLLNDEWGRVWEVDPLIPLLDMVARLDVDEDGAYIPLSAPVLGYQGGLVRDRETGNLRPILPYNLIAPASQWQAQIGLRVSF